VENYAVRNKKGHSVALLNGVLHGAHISRNAGGNQVDKTKWRSLAINGWMVFKRSIIYEYGVKTEIRKKWYEHKIALDRIVETRSDYRIFQKGKCPHIEISIAFDGFRGDDMRIFVYFERSGNSITLTYDRNMKLSVREILLRVRAEEMDKIPEYFEYIGIADESSFIKFCINIGNRISDGSEKNDSITFVDPDD